MARVVGSDAATDNRIPVAVTAYFRVLGGKVLNYCTAFVTPFVTGFTPRNVSTPSSAKAWSPGRPTRRKWTRCGM